MNYPPYSGINAKCAKCGHRGATTQYRGHGRCSHSAEDTLSMEVNERLHRTCMRCRYEWDEDVVHEEEG